MKTILVFSNLILLIGLSLYFSDLKWALLFATLKALLIGYYFMELQQAHTVWKTAYTILILSLGLGSWMASAFLVF